MDNRFFDIRSVGSDNIDLAIKLAWSGTPGGKATHFVVEKNTLILLWGEEGGAVKLPFRLGSKEAHAFVIGWLNDADYGPQPEHDGSNGRGFRIFTEDWGHVFGYYHAISVSSPCGRFTESKWRSRDDRDQQAQEGVQAF